MTKTKQSTIQRFFKLIFPASWNESTKPSSRQWKLHCRKCGFERSILEMGDIRWKAAGNAKNFGTCPKCEKVGWLTTYQTEIKKISRNYQN